MIRKYPRIPFLLLLLVWHLPPGWSQDPAPAVPVNRSANKVLLEGKVYYIHVVAEKQTMYGISKAYNVTQKVLAAENPAVLSGLFPGMVLKIPAEPVLDESATGPDPDPERRRGESPEYHRHTLRAGETLFFLSRKYGIDVEVIEQANPSLDPADIPVGTVLNIPKRKAPEERQAFPTESFVYHYVRPEETLYSLSKQYNVSIEEIKEINPELRWGELRFDQYIKIPRAADSLRVTLPPDAIPSSLDSLFADSLGLVAVPDTVEEVEDSLGVPFWSTLRRRDIRPDPIEGSIRIAMLLPLDLHWDEVADTLDLEEEEEDPTQEVLEAEEDLPLVNPRTVGYLEFLEGAFLALDTLRKQGYSVELHIYDTERNRQRTRDILAKEAVAEMDLIIGPVIFWNLEIVAEFARQHQIPLITPFTSEREIVRYNPWVIQLTPTYEIEFRQWAEYLSDQYDKSLILVHSGDSAEMERIRFLKNELFRNIRQKADLDDVIFKEVVMNDSTDVDMSHVLTHDQDNLVIVPSDNEAYVSKVVSPLFYLLDEYSVEVSGMPQWNKFRNIDLEYFHELRISYYTSFYMDYEKQMLQDFIREFYEVYRTEPYRIYPRGYNLSVYGYDIVKAFVPGLSRYGNRMIHYLDELDADPILGAYDLERINDFGGHVNTHLTLIQFLPDLEIQQVQLDQESNRYRYRRYRGSIE